MHMRHVLRTWCNFNRQSVTSQAMLHLRTGNEGPASGSGGLEGGGPSRSGRPQGAGPRIYVGGIPNAVSETMVRKYFSSWGKVSLMRLAFFQVMLVKLQHT